jgi:hypothetical protein
MYVQQPYDFDVAQFRALLLEIIRRAAYDWVMYRNNRRLMLKRVAEDAYVWLFVEAPGHPDWLERERDGWQLFSFLAICDYLDLEPSKVRWHIKRLTPQRIQAMGRPPTHRRTVPAHPELETVETNGVNLADHCLLLNGGELLNFEP